MKIIWQGLIREFYLTWQLPTMISVLLPEMEYHLQIGIWGKFVIFHYITGFHRRGFLQIISIYHHHLIFGFLLWYPMFLKRNFSLFNPIYKIPILHIESPEIIIQMWRARIWNLKSLKITFIKFENIGDTWYIYYWVARYCSCDGIDPCA